MGDRAGRGRRIVSVAARTEPRRTRSARLRGGAGGGDGASGRLVARFVGREELLAQFIGAISEDPRSAARIVGVSGPPGVGKSRFVEEALGRVVRSGRPVTTVRPDLAAGIDGAAWLRAFMTKLPIGGAMLSGAISRFAQDPAARLDESSARALLNALFHETYDCGVERRGLLRPKFQRLAIVLDDFDLIPPNVAVWLAQEFLPRLDEVRGHLDYVLLLVGERALGKDLEPVAWAALPIRFFALEVPPLTEAESVELLALYARRSAEAKACHEIGEGLPGAMLELLRHRVSSLGDLATTLDRCSPAQARALVAVAGLGFATEEGLRLVLGDEGPTAAANLLEAGLAVPVFGSLRQGGLWLPGAVARLVQDRHGSRHAEVAKVAREIGDLLDVLAVHFPSTEDREWAAALAVFRFFDGEALRACFGPQEGARLESFVHVHAAAYETTEAGNRRLLEELQPSLVRYAQLRADPARGALRERVSRLWTERAAELQALHKNAAAGLARLERDRDDLLKELEAARGQVGHCVQENHKEWSSRIDENIVRLGTSLLANGAGVACFWIALFTDEQRLTFLVIGAILIGIGIGTPAMARGRKAPRVDPAAAARRRQEARVGEARGVVNLIEARIAALQQRLTEERRKVEKLRVACEEAYL